MIVGLYKYKNLWRNGMRKFFLLVTIIAGLTGCSVVSIPDYNVTTNDLPNLAEPLNKIKIKSEAATFDDAAWFMCRGTGYVRSKTKKTYTEYITDALKQEVKSRGFLDENSGIPFTIKLTHVEVSTALGSTHWNIDSTCSIAGKSFNVSTTFNGRSSFSGFSACDRIAQYFEKAVRKHIEQIFANPVFRENVHWVEASGDSLPDISSRLKKLEKLHTEGLITDDEYRVKRKAIIDSF
jgi:hypothetical protein